MGNRSLSRELALLVLGQVSDRDHRSSVKADLSLESLLEQALDGLNQHWRDVLDASAEDLENPDLELDEDVIVCSDDPEAKTLVMDLVKSIEHLRPIDGGGLSNSKYVEQITPLLVNINRIYKIHAGIKITGI